MAWRVHTREPNTVAYATHIHASGIERQTDYKSRMVSALRNRARQNAETHTSLEGLWDEPWTR